jgi:hypothetical protein
MVAERGEACTLLHHGHEGGLASSWQRSFGSQNEAMKTVNLNVLHVIMLQCATPSQIIFHLGSISPFSGLTMIRQSLRTTIECKEFPYVYTASDWLHS